MVHFVPLGQLHQIGRIASDLHAVRPLELVQTFVFQNEVFGVQLAERLAERRRVAPILRPAARPRLRAMSSR